MDVVVSSVIEHGMTQFRFQTAQKNSASLRYSIWQFENSNDVILCSITEQNKPSFVLTVNFNILFQLFSLKFCCNFWELKILIDGPLQPCLCITLGNKWRHSSQAFYRRPIKYLKRAKIEVLLFKYYKHFTPKIFFRVM